MGSFDKSEESERQPLLTSSGKKVRTSSTTLHVDTIQKTGWLSSSFIIANITLGVGLLNFPAAYKDAGGIPQAITIQAICLLFASTAFMFLAYASDVKGDNTYQDVLHSHAGPVALVVCNLFIFIHNFGSCITFLVILGDQIDQITSYGYGLTFCHYWYMCRTFTLTVISIILILPFCYPKVISDFKFISMLGIFAVLYILGLSIYKYSTNTDPVDLPEYRADRWLEIFKVMPTICFSFEGHIESVPVYACLKKRNLSEFARAIASSLFMSCTIYTIIGAFGFLTFGESVKSDFLLSYRTDVPVIIAMAIIALKVITTYPAVFYCARLVIDDLVRYSFKLEYEQHERKRRYIITTVLFMISLIVAQAVPTIGSVIALLGGTAALFIFVFPGLSFMHANLLNVSKYGGRIKDLVKTGFGILFVILGFFIAGSTTAQSIIRYKSGEFSERDVICS
ncbi:DgyrCDS5682 [Dimorphilus gyrociliatus]|uniref:DgyrCDS5682 n=1 Tax=Dimorphilus gyrociliatus TaxID=2664684 RepID=A0A7I8VL90_9ANNE|nr:DgyrCDS5682 [Dimorphilus gyrociliatus]